MKKSVKAVNQIKQINRDLSYCVEPILQWYDENKRNLPWRKDISPYRVWVSEIMLQQTRVEAVKPYYARFMERLPDVASLAYADTEELLKLWEGLGYYSRVRNMQKAALMVCEQYGGQMPTSYEALLALPGIGSYTAGAISSITAGERVPAVDGNVLRVLARLTMDDDDISDAKTKQRVFEELKAIMPKESGKFNQALMELGATVCIPNGAPKCESCPWQTFCKAHQNNKTDMYPFKAPKKARQIEKKTILIIRDDDCVILHQRDQKGLLAGMYEFPMLEKWQKQDDIIAEVNRLGLVPLYVKKIAEAKHIFSHKEWHMKGYLVKVEQVDKDRQKLPEAYKLVRTEDTKEAYPIPSAFSAFTPYVGIELTGEQYKREKTEQL